MKLRTLKSWNKRGRIITKGSKAVQFNEKGEALFYKEQTRKLDENWYCDREPNEYGGHYFFGDENPDQFDYDMGLCGQE